MANSLLNNFRSVQLKNVDKIFNKLVAKNYKISPILDEIELKFFEVSIKRVF